jgi:hypothetical protein
MDSSETETEIETDTEGVTLDIGIELEKVVQALQACDTSYIDTLITQSLLVPLADPDYLEGGTFCLKSFLVRPTILKQFKKERISLQKSYTLSEYQQLLTSYIIDKKCVDAMGIITPTPFLQKVFKISDEPCSIIKFFELATRIFV